MSMKRRGLIAACVVLVAIVSLVFAAIVGKPATAQSNGEFYLQVSPSPLVTVVKPGKSTTVEVKIRNAGSAAENLKIAPRSFTFDSKTQQLYMDDNKAPPVADWIKFSAPTFTVQPGQWFTQKVTFAVPKEAGFSYAFTLVITRANATQAQPAPNTGQVLKGSVALFTLINVDRPGATRKLELASLTTSKRIYEHPPVDLELNLKNTGNSITQPAGNVFIQRRANDKNPIDTLEVNESSGFILPDTTRTFRLEWNNGFQAAKKTTNADGSISSQTSWNWGRLSSLRIGRYTAKLVAVYNDGQRDVPIEGEVSFWVIPWKMLLVVLAVVVIIGFGLWSVISKSIRLAKRIKR